MAMDIQPFVWGAGGGRMSPEEIAAQHKVAQAMMARGSDYSPVQSPWQGAARVAQAMLGGWQSGQADAASKANTAAEAKLMSELFSGQPPATPVAAPVAPAAAPASGIPAGKEEFVASILPMAQEASAKTGIDPRIIVAQAAIESGWGKSAPGNNLFGIKSHGQPGGNVLPTTEVVNGQPVRTTDSFRSYGSPAESVSGYADFINTNPRYAPVKAAQGLEAQAAALGQSGYATDPAYGQKVASIAQGIPSGAPAMAQAPAGPVPPQAAPAAPAAAQSPYAGVNPRLVQALSSPYISDGAKRVLGIMLQQQMSQNKTDTIDLGNEVGIIRNGQIISRIPKGEPNKGPSFVDGPPDPATGLPTKVWADPRDKSVTPYQPPAAANTAPSTIPPAPPGVDPKVWREENSKRVVQESLPPKFDDVQSVRKEVQNLPSYKNMSQAAPIYKSMLETAGTNSKASDLNLVYGLGKIFDPGSVVREGEMVMVKNSASLPDWLIGAANSLNGGAALTPETRAAILREAHNRIQSYKTLYDQDAQFYRGIAGRGRMKVEDVIPDFGEFKSWEPPKAPTGPAAPVVIDGYKIRAK